MPQVSAGQYLAEQRRFEFENRASIGNCFKFGWKNHQSFHSLQHPRSTWLDSSSTMMSWSLFCWCNSQPNAEFSARTKCNKTPCHGSWRTYKEHPALIVPWSNCCKCPWFEPATCREFYEYVHLHGWFPPETWHLIEQKWETASKEDILTSWMQVFTACSQQ